MRGTVLLETTTTRRRPEANKRLQDGAAIADSHRFRSPGAGNASAKGISGERRDMRSTTGPADGRAAHREDGAVDWQRIEGSSEFNALVARRRRFLRPAAIVTFGGFAVYLLLATFADGFMGAEVAGVPVAWLAAMTQVLLTWVVTTAYLRTADRTFAPLERRVVETAQPRFTREQPAPAGAVQHEGGTR
jgi:uncharacterized membrane protein (DUF485 family)